MSKISAIQELFLSYPKLNQSKLAQALGVDPSFISKVLRNTKNTPPNNEGCKTLADHKLENKIEEVVCRTVGSLVEDAVKEAVAPILAHLQANAAPQLVTRKELAEMLSISITATKRICMTRWLPRPQKGSGIR